MHRYPVPPAWGGAIEGWARALSAAGRSDQTIETRTEAIRRFARQIGAPSPALVSRSRLIEWAGAHEWSRETRRSMYASIRGFYSWTTGAGICTDDPTDALPTIKPGPAVPRPAPEDVYRSALREADDRARVVLRLAGESGLRRSEIAGIRREDMTRDLAGWSLLVHGKGGRPRIIPLSDSVAREVLRRFATVPGPWLFPSSTGGHLTARHLARVTRRYLSDGWTLHTLRHRFATRAYSGSNDLLTVRDLLGHVSVATTQRYVRPPDDGMRAAIRGAAV